MATPADLSEFSHIVHATDFSAASEPAYDHALRLAVAAKSHFYLVHAEHPAPGEDANWAAFPGVRSTLGRWGMLPADAAPAAVHAQLGVRVTKAEVPDHDPVDGVLRFITDNRCDFLVLGTHAREDVGYWLKGSIAETLARRAAIPTLFFPVGARAFVDHATGTPNLRNILLPADLSVPPAAAAAMVLRMADALGCKNAMLHALHVGAGEQAPVIAVDAWQEPRMRRVEALGSVVEAIVAQAEAIDADLIVMATRGHDGMLDQLRGSTTEQVLHHAGRALLAVPAG